MNDRIWKKRMFAAFLAASVSVSSMPVSTFDILAEATTEQETHSQNLTVTNQENSQQAENGDFVIEKGCLVSYKGTKEQVTLPEGIITVGEGAFENNSTLKEIIFSAAVEQVDARAFANCKSLQKISFTKSIRRIGEYAFAECDSLEKVTIPSADVVFSAFYGCSKLKEVYIGAGVRRLEGTFWECGQLSKVTFEPGIVAIGEDTFYHTKLESVELPDTLSYIGASAFYTNTLKEVSLPMDSLKYVDSTAFSETKWQEELENKAQDAGEAYVVVENVLLDTTSRFLQENKGDGTIPKEVTVLGNFQTMERQLAVPSGITGVARVYGENLEEVSLPNSVTSLGFMAFGGNEKLKTVHLSDYITSLDWGVFMDCEALETITFSNCLTSIELEAFENCSTLKQVTLPESLERIGDRAFAECSSLKEIQIPETVVSIGEDVFQGVSEDFVIVGTEGSYAEAYAKEQGYTFRTMVGGEKEVIVEQENVSAGEPKGETYQVTLDAVDGVVEKDTITVTNGETYKNLPTAGKSGYLFAGWYTSPVEQEGIRIENNIIVNLDSDQKLYARYISQKCTISFEPNGGKLPEHSSDSRIVLKGECYGELPQPEARENETFLGWFTSEEGGNQVIAESVVNVTGEQTLYAHWGKDYEEVSLDTLRYEFSNIPESFGYEKKYDENGNYRIPKVIYEYMLGKKESTNQIYNNVHRWGGNCFGMTASSLLFNEPEDDVEHTDFNRKATNIAELLVGDRSAKSHLSLTEFIECMQVAQYNPVVLEERSRTENDLAYLCEKAQAMQEERGYPILLMIIGPTGENAIASHALVIYKYVKGKMYVYDPNDPMTEHYITIEYDEQDKPKAWKYCVNNMYDWGSDVEGSTMCFASYESLLAAWNTRTSEQYVRNTRIQINVTEARVYDAGHKLVAEVENGMFHSYRQDVYAVVDTNLFENASGICTFYAPEGTYEIQNTSMEPKLEVSMTGDTRSVQLETEADTVCVTVDEGSGSGTVVLLPQIEKTYSIVMCTQGEAEVVVNGSGKEGKDILVEQTTQGLAIESQEKPEVQIAGENVEMVQVKAGAGEGGIISRAGNKDIIKGIDAQYAITPDYGYMIQDVKVDGVSKGNISSYTFQSINRNHEIAASFTRASFEHANMIVNGELNRENIENCKVKIGKQILTKKNEYVLNVQEETEKSMKVNVLGRNSYANTSMLIKIDKEKQQITQLSWSLDGNETLTGVPLSSPSANPLETEMPVANTETPVTNTEIPVVSVQPEEHVVPTVSVLPTQTEVAVSPVVPTASSSLLQKENAEGTAVPKEQSGDGTQQIPSNTEQPLQQALASQNETNAIEVGKIYEVKNFLVKVTSTKKQTVSVCGVKKSCKKAIIPNTVQLAKQKYKVTKIENKAWYKDIKLEKVVIGKNVSEVGSSAFYGAKNLEWIQCNSNCLKKVGKQALKGISSKAVIKVPKEKKKRYTKLWKKKGQNKKVKIKA